MAFKRECSREPMDAIRRDLPTSFSPGDDDVICGKGKTCFLHSGNKRFRKLVSHYLDRYSDASTKLEKSAIVSTIIGAVRSRSPNGGFVKLDQATGRWQEVGDYLAREKVGQTMRDALHGNYKSSTKAKKMRRQAEQAKADDSLTHITNAHCTIASKIEDLMRNVVHSQSDRQTLDMFTKANIEILNALNQLNQSKRVLPHLHSLATLSIPPETRSSSGVQFDSRESQAFPRSLSPSGVFPFSVPLPHQIMHQTMHTDDRSEALYCQQGHGNFEEY